MKNETVYGINNNKGIKFVILLFVCIGIAALMGGCAKHVNDLKKSPCACGEHYDGIQNG